MVVEKDGLGAFNYNNINMLLFKLLLLKHCLYNIRLRARSIRGMLIEILLK